MPSGAAFRAGGGGGRGGGGGGGGGGAATPTALLSDPDLRSLCQVTTGRRHARPRKPTRKFVEAGGVVVAAGSAAESIAATLQLPVSDYLTERQPGQPERALSSDKFYVPGSIVRVAVDPAAPSAAGSEDHIDVFFNNSPVFRLAERRLAWHPPGDVVRLRRPCAAAGRGGRTISTAAPPRSRPGWAGTRTRSDRDHVPRAAARHVHPFNAIHAPARGSAAPTGTTAAR